MQSVYIQSLFVVIVTIESDKVIQISEARWEVRTIETAVWHCFQKASVPNTVKYGIQLEMIVLTSNPQQSFLVQGGHVLSQPRFKSVSQHLFSHHRIQRHKAERRRFK